MRKSLFLVALLAAAPMMSFAADVPVKVEVIGVRADFVDDDTVQFHRIKKRSVMELQFTAPEGKAFTKNTKFPSAVVVSCYDGSGKVLEDAGTNMSFAQISEDGKKMVCFVETASLTPDGVMQIIGDVPVTMARGKMKQPAVVIDVKKGSKASVAGYEVEIKNIKLPSGLVKETVVPIAVVGEDFMADMEFESLDGKKLSVGLWGCSSSCGSKSKIHEEYRYAFDAIPEKMNLIVSVWQDEEKVNVPVNVKASWSGPVK